MSKINYVEYIEAHTLRCEASYRGGGIEIDATDLFPYREDASMTAYQNYLGGGMLGQICSDANFTPQARDQKKFDTLEDQLKRYFHNLTNHEDDEWEEESYEHNQLRKDVSAY